jgi:hypothetical protein
VAVVIEAVRHEWEDGYRRFEAALRDPVAAERLNAQLEVVTDELRRRIGQTFTIEQLAISLRRSAPRRSSYRRSPAAPRLRLPAFGRAGRSSR